MVLPADMPDIETGDMVRMIADFHAAPCDALQGATASGALGHPTLIAAEWSDRIQTLTGDKGAAKLIAALQDTRSFTLDSDRARLDLDTPEDWAKWRARQRR
jgi:molybdenum cofactor cytidylyltransferase